MRRWIDGRGACLAIGISGVAACTYGEPDIDQAWGLGETRVLHRERLRATLCLTECVRTPGVEPDACEAQCTASSIPGVSEAKDALAECLGKIESTYHRCARWYGYRPDTCASLGYPSLGVTSCAQ